MQLATAMITHDDALPFWAGLMDCAKSGKDGECTRFSVPAGEHLDPAKKQEVLDYLQQATRRIRIHLKSFDRAEKGVAETCGGFCCAFPFEQQDSSDKNPDQPKFYHGWQNGPALHEDYFAHIYMNMHHLVDFDMWTHDWMSRTASELREAMLRFATTLCYQFAHAMADISQNGGASPHLNDETFIEPGFSWEQFVFGGRLNPDGNGRFWVAPWPDCSTEQFYANGGRKLDLCAFGRAAVPTQGVSVVEDSVWQQLFYQNFWDEADLTEGALKKLWLRDGEAGFDQSRCAAREVVARRMLLDKQEKQRRDLGAVQSEDLVVNEVDESQEAQGDFSTEIPSCGSWWLDRWMAQPDEDFADPWSNW